MKLAKRDYLAGGLVISLVFWSMSVAPVGLAVNSPTIAITDINGNAPPFSFSCATNPLFNPVAISGDGSGATPPGDVSQYHIQIDWGDGIVQNRAPSTFTPSSGNHVSFNFVFNGTHIYATSNNFTIKARLYHSTPPGNDNQADSVVTVVLCVHVPPPSKGSVQVVKVINNTGGGTATTTDFTYAVGATTVLSGAVNDFSPGTYAVTESGALTSQYNAAFTGDCNASGAVTVVAGNHYTCTITNTFNSAPPPPPPPPPTFTLTVTKSGTGAGGVSSTPSGIDCGSTCSASFNASTTVTLTATPGASSTFADWSGACTATSTICTFIVNGTSSVTATFNLQPTNGGGGGGGGGGSGGGGGNSSTTADIAIAKTADSTTPVAGGMVTYTITVSALGPETSTGVTASDVLPSGLSLILASASAGTYNTSTGEWTIGTLSPNATATLVISAALGSSTASTTITNTATVSESSSLVDPPGNDSSSVLIFVQSASSTSSNTSGGGSSSSTTGGGGGSGGGGGTSGGTSSGGGGSNSGGGTGYYQVGSAGTGGGQVLGAATSTGQVLGASTTCDLYLNDYIHPVRKNLNNPSEVKKLQTFLNQNLGTTLPITGFYGALSETAVNQFQLKYSTEVLAPWIPYGLPNEHTPTGYVYKTTKRWINMIMCPALGLPIPPLP